MDSTERTAGAGPAPVIENPVSGEQIVIHGVTPAAPQPAAQGQTAHDQAAHDQAALHWELFLAPGGRVPSAHAHPRQEERFEVVAGHLRLRVRHRVWVLGPGQARCVPPGAVHSFANAGPGTAHVLVRTSPPLEMAALLHTAAAMARETQRTARLAPTVPRLHELALFLRDFRAEVRAPYLPAALVAAVIRPAAWLVRRAGLDARYRRLRPRPGG